MADKIIQLPDGRNVAFPDSMTDDQISSAIKANMGSAETPNATKLGRAPAPEMTGDFQHPDAGQFGANLLGHIGDTFSGLIEPLKTPLKSLKTYPGTASAMGAIGEQAKQDRTTMMEDPGRATSGLLGDIAGAGLLDLGVKAGGKVADAVPSKARASARFNEIAPLAQGLPVDMAKVKPFIDRLQTLDSNGGNMPDAVKKLSRKGSAGSIPYEDGRDFSSNLSRLTREDAANLSPEEWANMGGLNSALHDALKSTADTIGRGKDYAKATKEYGQAAKLASAGKTIGKFALGSGATALGAGGLYELIKRLM